MKNKDDLINDDLRNWSSIYVLWTCFCLPRLLNMNWFWVYIVWVQKLAVMHILVITDLPFRNPVNRFYVTVKAKIWISEYPACRFSYPVSRFWNPDCRLQNPDSRLCSRSLLPRIRIAVYHIWLAACHSNRYNVLFFKIIVWPQNFIKLYYGLKRYESFQIGPISEFLNNTLSIPKLFEIMISPKLCEIIEWPKIFKYFQIVPNPKL